MLAASTRSQRAEYNILVMDALLIAGIGDDFLFIFVQAPFLAGHSICVVLSPFTKKFNQRLLWPFCLFRFFKAESAISLLMDRHKILFSSALNSTKSRIIL